MSMDDDVRRTPAIMSIEEAMEAMKQWEDWLNLCEEDDADRAFDPVSILAFHASSLDNYNLNDITHLGEIRDDYQWSRVWCIHNKRYEWHWLPIIPEDVPEFKRCYPPTN
jgi:hypothetical protein